MFVSGRGSNLQAILNSQELHKLVEVKAVVSDKSDCPAFSIASSFSIPVYYVGKNENRTSYTELSNLFYEKEIELIVLAGFLKLLPGEFVNAFRNRILNIHPALLPSFGGAGMYGMNVHKAVFDSSAKISGATVHFVDEKFDNGIIIAQQCVDIQGVKSPEEIASKVLKVEHQLLPSVIKNFALGKISIDGNRVRII